MNLLLMSSSRSADSGFLEANEEEIRETLHGVKRALFIPYAILGEERAARIPLVTERFASLGVVLDNIDDAAHPVAAVMSASAIVVSGGNTFQLLKTLYDHGLVDVLRQRISDDVPYVGWSAGSNIAGRSIRTTNDMPIVYPPTFRALDLVPFQLNPHYTDAIPAGLKGETRAQRIEEFLAVNPAERVIGLPEGDALLISARRMQLVGRHDAWLFEAGKPRLRLAAGRELSHLL